MNDKRKLLDYIHSEQFLVDTMIHREGDNYVYLEAIPADGRKKMEWINGHLFNCKKRIKHVGAHVQIADIIAKKLGVAKIDEEASKRAGRIVFTEEYAEIDYMLTDLPEVTNADEVK